MYKYLLVVWLLLIAFTAMAQRPDTTTKVAVKKLGKDTLTATRRDSIKAKKFIPKINKERVFHPDSNHSPHTAVIRSLLIPGWGQIYNHRWWKVPIIYGGLTLLGVAIVYNNTNYNLFLTLSKYREFGTTPVPGQKDYIQAVEYAAQDPQALYDATDGYRRDRDLSILGVFAVWGINVVDAYIDAKFIHSYSIDTDFSFQVSPVLLNQQTFAQNFAGPYIPGLKVTFTF